jgi:phosphatidylserine/phosphatidylglycerophosphate/cardiolipin synthase-like enzyme
VTKKSRARKSSSQKSGCTSQLIAIAVVVVIVTMGGIYLCTGRDPMGLFEPGEGTSVAPATAQVPTPTTGAGPGPTSSRTTWWEVYFTDPNKVNDPDNLRGSIPEKLIAYINESEHTIHVAAFELNLTPVAEALIAAHERGVEVQWVTDDEHGLDADWEEGHGQFAMLEDVGIEVKDDGRSALMHNKFWVFDDQTVWTGSTNVTVNGNFRNNNNVIVIHSPDVATMYEREFQEMWDGQFGPTSPSTVDLQSTVVARTPVQVLFAAEDEAISHLVPLVENAQESIRIMAYSFTHDALGEAVLQRAQKGVDVKGIFETRGSQTEYSELTILYCAKVPVRQDGNPGSFHHKVIVIDEQTTITGSLNFSNNADESNDENVVVIENETIADRYLQEFERRWDEATDPDPKDISCKKR